MDREYMDEGYMHSKFKFIDNWKEAVYHDAPVVLVWCDNYRHINHLIHDLYHKASDGYRDRVKLIKHRNEVHYMHINKKFVFRAEAIKFRGYSMHTSVVIDMRGKDAF